MPLFCCGGKKATEEPLNAKEPPKETNADAGEPMDVKFSDLKDLFDLFDHNNDGLISKEEIAVNLRALRLPISDDDVNFMMSVYDTNGDNSLNFIEFTKLIKHYMETNDFPLDEMFKYFDENDDQSINLQEFVKAMRCLGVDMSEAKAKEILPAYYTPGTEMIAYDNFVKLMKTYFA